MAKQQADKGAELAAKAVDTSSDDERAEIEKALEQLTPEQAEMFLEVLELTMKRRRIMLAGYALALVAMLGGMMWALYTYGTREYGTFVGWVFFVPFIAVGAILWIFGRWSKSVKPSQKRPGPQAAARE
jgi:uncharacterized membrane protein (DUF106 family)